MLEGKSWSIGISTSNIEIFFGHIEKEYGIDKLTNALIATKNHLLDKGEWGKGRGKEILVKRFASRNHIDIDSYMMAETSK